MADVQEPTREEVRKKVLEFISEHGSLLTVGNVWNAFPEERRPRDAHGHPTRVFGDNVLDVFRELHLRGVVAYKVDYDPGGQTSPLQFKTAVHLTEAGRKVREEGAFDSIEWLTADEYVDAVEAAAGGKLDPVIRTYLREAKRALDERLWLSCAVTLGCASEKAILCLGEAAKAYFQDPKLTKVIDDERCWISTKFTEIIKRLKDRSNQKTIRKDAAHIGADASPLGELSVVECLFQLYRIHRNDAGHPTGRQPDRDVLLCYLQGVKTYARIVTGLTSLLGQLFTTTP